MKLNKAIFALIFFLATAGTFLITRSIDNDSTEKKLALQQRNQEIASYFGEICIGSEYEWIIPVTHKFKTKAKLFVVKDSSYSEQIKFIKKVLSEFNRLPTDGFSITLTDDSASANIHLYLSSNNPLPKQKKAENDVLFGQFLVTWKNLYITDALIFIDTSRPLNQQKSAILEEIVQSLGFMKDTDFYMNSIFYQYKYQLKKDVHALSSEDKSDHQVTLSSKDECRFK